MAHSYIGPGLVFMLLFLGAMPGKSESRAPTANGEAGWPGTQMIMNQRKALLSGHKDDVKVLVFAPDGRMLATGSDDKTVKLWDASSGRLIRTLTGHDGSVYDVRFSPDGRTLASLSDDRKPRLWNVLTGELQATLTGHHGKIYNLEFSPDGQMIVTGSGDGTAKLWDTATGKPGATLRATSSGSGLKRLFSRDVNDLFIFPTGHFSPNGQLVLTFSGDKTPQLWDAATGELKARLEHDRGVMSAVFSRDGRWVATESDDDNVRLWETSTGQLRRVLAGHKNSIYDLSFSPDGFLLATASRDGTAILWDVRTGDLKSRLGGFDGRVPRVAFSPDGKFLAAKGGYKNHVVKLWNVATGELMFTLPLPGRKDDIEEIAFSPDGPELMTSSDKTVQLWDTRNGRLIASLQGARQPAVFSSDGNQVATRGPDNSAILWDVPL